MNLLNNSTTNILEKYNVIVEEHCEFQQMIPIYIINLKSNLFRRNYVKFLMNKMHLNYKIIIVEPIAKQTYDFLTSNFKRKTSISEMGCCLSHLWCLNNAITLNHSNFLILEDDIIFHKNFKEMFKHVSIVEYDMIMLGACDFNNKRNNTNMVENYPLYKPTYNALGGHANLYALKFAKVFLNHKINNFCSLDCNYSIFYKDYNIYVCEPNLVICELSTTNLRHNYSPTQINNYNQFYNKCLPNLNYNDYNIILIDFLMKIYEYAKHNSIEMYNFNTLIEIYGLKIVNSVKTINAPETLSKINNMMSKTYYDVNDLTTIFNAVTNDIYYSTI